MTLLRMRLTLPESVGPTLEWRKCAQRILWRIAGVNEKGREGVGPSLPASLKPGGAGADAFSTRPVLAWLISRTASPFNNYLPYHESPAFDLAPLAANATPAPRLLAGIDVLDAVALVPEPRRPGLPAVPLAPILIGRLDGADLASVALPVAVEIGLRRVEGDGAVVRPVRAAIAVKVRVAGVAGRVESCTAWSEGQTT